MSQSYKTGTVTVAAGSTSVVGSGTAFALALASGGLFCCQGASIPCVVVDDTHLTLDYAWPGANGTALAYSIFRETAQAASAEKANDRLAEVADRLNKLSYINFDAMGPLAQRAAYNSAPKDFIFLDITADPFALYIKGSDAAGDWKGPNPYGQGARGLPGADSTVPGPKGEAAGRRFTFSTTVTDANPGNGFLRFSNATFASITNLFVSTTDGSAGGATEFLDRMGASSNTDKGLIRVQHADNPAIYREFVVSGVTTATSYRKVVVTPLSSAGTLANNTVVMITFAATGDKGGDFSSMATASIKGRVTAGAGAPEDLTATQVMTLLKTAGAYARDNILGTVLQSGGVPTGAVIERGSNANGEYVRFADGMAIFWKTAALDLSVSTADAVTGNWTFPTTIISGTGYVTVTLPSAGASYVGVAGTSIGALYSTPPGSTGVSGLGYRRIPGTTAWVPGAGNGVAGCYAFGIGRWF